MGFSEIEVHFAGNGASATVFDTLAYAYTEVHVSPGASELDDDYAVLVVNERWTAGGQSGSPMFGFWPNDPVAYAVAVISAIGHVFASGLETWCAGGSDRTRLVNQARTESP